MKAPVKIIGFTAFFVAATLYSAPLVFATGSSGQKAEGDTPPYGLHVEGDAKGTKLNGSIMVEYYNLKEGFQEVEAVDVTGDNIPDNCTGTVVLNNKCCGGTPDITAAARVVLRLRQGSEDKNLYTYFADVGEIPLTGDPADIQMAIQSNADLKKSILEDFFGVTDGAAMTITLKSISEFGVVPGDVSTELSGDPNVSTFYDIDAGDSACTSQAGGSRFLMADVVIAVN